MKKVLFVCIHNSARSQMAEAFLNRLSEGRFEAESAGLEPAAGLNPHVVRVMQEIGYDLSGYQTKLAFDMLKQGRQYDLVIKVCDQSAGQRCPIFPSAVASLQWSFDDPSQLTGTQEEVLAGTRRIRDQIRQRIEEFLRVVVIG